MRQKRNLLLKTQLVPKYRVTIVFLTSWVNVKLIKPSKAEMEEQMHDHIFDYFGVTDNKTL